MKSRRSTRVYMYAHVYERSQNATHEERAGFLPETTEMRFSKHVSVVLNFGITAFRKFCSD